MYVSQIDKLNSGHAWFVASTYQATRPQDWTPQAELYLSYQRHAEASGIPPRQRLTATQFAMELYGLMRRKPRIQEARPFNGGEPRPLPFWPRVIRSPRTVQAAA